MKRRLSIFFLVLIYLFNNIFVSTTLGRFVQESTSAKFNVSAAAKSQTKSLSEFSWQEIYDITVAGKAETYWNVGDKRTVDVNGADYEVIIVGINHDGENTVTFSFNEDISTGVINNDASNGGSWENSYMRTVTMPSILDQMENKDFIKEVEKKTIKGYTDGIADGTQSSLVTSNDKLFLFSYTEVFGDQYNGSWDNFEEGALYEYFATRKNKIMEPNETGYGSYQWWLRSPFGDYEQYYNVDFYGYDRADFANSVHSIVPGFVIGKIPEQENLALLPTGSDFFELTKDAKTITFDFYSPETYPDIVWEELPVIDEGNTGVIKMFVDNEDNYYVLSEQIIYANPDSSKMFARDYMDDLPPLNGGEFINPGGSSLFEINFLNFDTSKVTDMSYMFAGCADLEELDVSMFNTTNVTNMERMFSYNGVVVDVSNFNTSNVTNMKQMFASISNETIDLSNFDTSNVTDMSAMFMGTQLKELDISNFDTSNVTNMKWMFGWNDIEEINFGDFDTSNVTDMSGMFEQMTISELDLSVLETTKATKMSSMFAGFQSNLELDLSKLDTTNVIDMEYMFSGFRNELLDVSSFDTSNVKNFTAMFEGIQQETLDISSFDFSNAIIFTEMFSGSGLSEIIFPETEFGENVTSAILMFAGCENLQNINLSNFKPEALESAMGMFSLCINLIEIDLTWLNTEYLINTAMMFGGCENLEHIYVDYQTWHLDSVAYSNGDESDFYNGSNYMFADCYKLPGFDPNIVDKTYGEVLVYDKNEQPYRLGYVEDPNYYFDFADTLDLLPKFELPEGFVVGETFIIDEMPDFNKITEQACDNAPDNTKFYGWLIESDFSQEIFEPADAEDILKDVYSSEEDKYILKLTPIYELLETKEEKLTEKTILFDIDNLYNIEIAEFKKLKKNEIVIEEDLELEFVFEEDFILYKNIELIIDETSYVLDLTNKKQELDGITFDKKDNILTVSYDLFTDNDTFVIKAVALENIPTKQLMLGEEISITDFIEADELLDSIEIPDNTEFVGWLINDEELEIENINIQEILNDVLTKIYPQLEIEQEKVQEEIDIVLEESTEEEIEEIETFLTPIFRLIKEEAELDNFVVGNETTIFEIPSETVLAELVASDLTEDLIFYGWLVDTTLKTEIVSQENLINVLTEKFASEEEIILTPLYTVEKTTEEQPEKEVEEEPEQEEIILPEENTESVEKEEIVSDNNDNGSGTSVKEEINGEQPEESIPTEQIININTNLTNISIPEISNGTITISNNENLEFSLETDKDYELPETIQLVIDKTYTINTNEKGSQYDGVTFNVLNNKIIISYELLSGVETITVKGIAVKIEPEEEQEENSSKDTSGEKVDNVGETEKDTEQTEQNAPDTVKPENKSDTDNIPENSENTETENTENPESTDTNNDTETDIEASSGDLEEPIDGSQEEQEVPENTPENEETDNVPSEEQAEDDTIVVNNESSTESNSDEPENNVEKTEKVEKTDTEAGVAKESNSNEPSSSNSNVPETSSSSTEPVTQPSASTSSSTETTNNSGTTSGSSGSGSSPDPGTSNSSNSNSNTGNNSSSSSTETTTSKKSESSNETSGSDTSEE